MSAGGGPEVIYVSGAGWDKANGLYLPIAQHEGAPVYENNHKFILSRERQHDGALDGCCGTVGWVVGVGHKPLYSNRRDSFTPPTLGWCAIRSWGKEPAPLIRAARDITEAVLSDVQSQLPVAAAAAVAEDWDTAAKTWRRALDQLAHLLDAEHPEVLRLEQQVRSELMALPLSRARAMQRAADAACQAGEWQLASDTYHAACSLVARLQGEEASALHAALQSEQSTLPHRKLEKAWADARSAFDLGFWEDAEAKLDMVAYHLKEDVSSSGGHAEAVRHGSTELREALVVRQADAALSKGEALARMRRFKAADAHFAEALQILAALQQSDSVGQRQEKLHATRARSAAELVDLLLIQSEVASEREDWAEVDARLEDAQAALRPCRDEELVVAARERVLSALGSAAERKVGAVRRLADEAAHRGDWSEADACWAEALQLLRGAPQGLQSLKGLCEELTAKRSWRACTAAGDLMRKGDISRLNDNIFDADDRYTEAIDWLLPHRSGVASMRCKLHAKRAEVRYRKWQYKQAVDDCTLVLQNSPNVDEKYRALLLAAHASRDLHVQLVREMGLEQAQRLHQMDAAVSFLAEAAQLDAENHELRREVRAWKREVPDRPRPVPMPPFDWSRLPKADKANYFGKAPRTVGLSDQEIQDIWCDLAKEPRVITGPEDPDFCGYDEVTALPRQREPRHISRRVFHQVIVKGLKCEVGEGELDALWVEADKDRDGLLSFEEFAQVMRLEDISA